MEESLHKFWIKLTFVQTIFQSLHKFEVLAGFVQTLSKSLHKQEKLIKTCADLCTKKEPRN